MDGETTPGQREDTINGNKSVSVSVSVSVFNFLLVSVVKVEKN